MKTSHLLAAAASTLNRERSCWRDSLLLVTLVTVPLALVVIHIYMVRGSPDKHTPTDLRASERNYNQEDGYPEHCRLSASDVALTLSGQGECSCDENDESCRLANQDEPQPSDIERPSPFNGAGHDLNRYGREGHYCPWRQESQRG